MRSRDTRDAVMAARAHPPHGPAVRAGLLLLLLLACVAEYNSQHIKIGVVVEDLTRASIITAAARAALKSGVERARVVPQPVEKPLDAARRICALAEENAGAVLLGGSLRMQFLAHEAAARSGIPLLLLDEPPRATAAHWEALEMQPHPAVLARAAADLCREKGWTRAVLLHEGGAWHAAHLTEPDPKQPQARPIQLLARQLPPSGSPPSALRSLMLVLKKQGIDNFLVWCEAECAERVLDAAQRAGMAADRHSFLLLARDLQVAALEPYSHGGANITAMRLFDPATTHMKDFMGVWRSLHDDPEDETLEEVQQEPPSALLLARDAVVLTTYALRVLNLPRLSSASCALGRGAFHADTLLNYLRSEDWNENGASGPLTWEADGSRQDVRLEVVEVARGGALEHAGLWTPSSGVLFQHQGAPMAPPVLGSMTNRTFNILIARNKPYVMRSESTGRLTGNKRYEGFCVELIERLAEILHFNYTFIEQEDGNYGKMLERLVEDTSVEFAITDLTITAEREQMVDFTTPFMNLGISILFRKPEPPKPQLFAFLLPFSNGVWLCLGLAYVGTSLVLYVVGRLCHEEWQNPYPCIDEPSSLENQFTLANALWFNLGAVLLQGSEIAPVAYGTRSVASAWWLFALVITSSYTANLATLMAKKSPTDLIHDVTELANNQLNIDYGAKDNGSTYTFFKQSQSPLYKKMFEHMKKKKMPGTNDIGISKVLHNTSLYAFLSESTSIEYEVERNCQLTKVGPLLDSKGYGIAMRKDSPYRQALNLALLNLQESGVLRDMKNSWWNEKHGGGACKAAEEFSSTSLEMSNFRGLFLVLCVGCSLGIALSALDLMLGSLRRARAAGESFWRRLGSDLRFVFLFEQSVKPLHDPLSSSSSGSDPEAEAEVEVEAEAEEGAEASRGRSASTRRRRSSMHAASLRLARHTAAARDSGTPAQTPRARSPRAPRSRTASRREPK